MKRIFYILLAFAVCFCLFGSTVALAAEATEAPEEVTSEAEEDSDANFFSRMYEAFVDNKTDIFTVSGSLLLFGISMLLKKDVGSTSKHIVDNIATVLSKADISDSKQTAIVNGLNEMVDGYNEIKEKSEAVEKTVTNFAKDMRAIIESNESLEAKIDNFFTVITQLMDKEILQNAEVMEVLASVYVNNDALPKGIKDFVSLKRTENAKLVQEATELVHKDEAVNE